MKLLKNISAPLLILSLLLGVLGYTKHTYTNSTPCSGLQSSCTSMPYEVGNLIIESKGMPLYYAQVRSFKRDTTMESSNSYVSNSQSTAADLSKANPVLTVAKISFNVLYWYVFLTLFVNKFMKKTKK